MGRRRGSRRSLKGRCAFAAEISEDRRRAAIDVAWRERAPRRRVIVEVAWYGRARDAVAEATRMYRTHDPVDFVVDGRSQSGTLVRPLTDAGLKIRQPTTQEVAVAHGMFMDLVDDGGLAHLGQQELTDAVRLSQQRPLAGARAWERRVPGTDQALLVAATLAVWAFLDWESGSEPGAWMV